MTKETYLAENGLKIEIRGSGVLAGTRLFDRDGTNRLSGWDHLNNRDMAALEEYLQAKRDKALGRFRHGDVVVYDADIYTRFVNEATGEKVAAYSDAVEAVSKNWAKGAAHAYAKHLQSLKSWLDAKHGEIWTLTSEGVEANYVASTKEAQARIAFLPLGTGAGLHVLGSKATTITAGKLVWAP